MFTGISFNLQYLHTLSEEKDSIATGFLCLGNVTSNLRYLETFTGGADTYDVPCWRDLRN